MNEEQGEMTPELLRTVRHRHAFGRAWERYRLRLSESDLLELEARAEIFLSTGTLHGLAVVRRYPSSLREAPEALCCEAVVHGVAVRYVYMVPEETLVTFIPRDLHAELSEHGRHNEIRTQMNNRKFQRTRRPGSRRNREREKVRQW